MKQQKKPMPINSLKNLKNFDPQKNKVVLRKASYKKKKNIVISIDELTKDMLDWIVLMNDQYTREQLIEKLITEYIFQNETTIWSFMRYYFDKDPKVLKYNTKKMFGQIDAEIKSVDNSNEQAEVDEMIDFVKDYDLPTVRKTNYGLKDYNEQQSRLKKEREECRNNTK